jgi:hypothetical protein
MQPLVKRALLRLLLVGLIGATFLPIGLARGQVGDVPSNPPGEEPRETQLEMAENPATVPEPEEGLQPAQTETEPTTANVGSVNVRTSECANGSGSDTRLGLMKNSAAYSHCP